MPITAGVHRPWAGGIKDYSSFIHLSSPKTDLNAHAFAQQAIYFETAGSPIPDVRNFRRADRYSIRGADLPHFDPDLDASPAAAVGLRQPPGAHAGNRDAADQPGAGEFLRNQLAGHS
ncbi:MAG: hypothetical protein WDN48_07115 [Pseudolabrys sp.]